jgi:uncharacterized membrane protein
MMSSVTIGLDQNATFSEVMAVFAPMIAGMMVISFIATLIAFAVSVFLTNPLSLGVTKWFIVERTQEKMNSITELFAAFRKGAYKRMVSGMAWKLLWTYLWSIVSVIPVLIPLVLALLFGINVDVFSARVSANFGVSNSAAIAGIIIVLAALYVVSLLICIMINLNRYYAYFYVPYILLDNTEIDFRETLTLSKQMSHGQKGHMFVLDLSFIGWWLLVSLTCGFLAIALYPYLYATYTELYFARKEEYDRPVELRTKYDSQLSSVKTEENDVNTEKIEDDITTEKMEEDKISIQEDS